MLLLVLLVEEDEDEAVLDLDEARAPLTLVAECEVSVKRVDDGISEGKDTSIKRSSTARIFQSMSHDTAGYTEITHAQVQNSNTNYPHPLQNRLVSTLDRRLVERARTKHTPSVVHDEPRQSLGQPATRDSNES